MENGYDRNAWYKFTDKDGNTYVSRGDNGYVQQSVTGGIPISIDANGNWYTEPFLELTKTGYVGHIPDWFKGTDEYQQWQTYTSQIPNLPVTKDSFTNLSSILKALGSQGAVRQSLIGDISKLGVVDKDLQRKFVNDIVAAVTEGKTGTAAKLNDIFGSNKDESVADIARSFKDMSKEELSSMITKLQYMASASGEKNWTGSREQQKQVLDAATTLKILNYVDDNYQQYGKDNEFQGLLQASLWQKFQRGVATASATFTESSIFGLPVRVAYGISNAAKGGDFSLQIEDSVNKQLSTNSSFGANLEGLEASEAIGMWGGALTNIAASIVTMRGVGSFLNSKFADSSAAILLNKMNNSGIVGQIAYDFFLNDLPLDIVMFINDIGRYNGNVVAALWNPEDPQPLTGIPFVRNNEETGFWMPSGLGPDVPGGLVMNVVGDLIVDCAPWLVKVANNSITRQMDGISNGGFTRLRENIAVQNLKLQQKFTEIPVVGTAWQKFIDGMMGAQKANLIREARKAAIAENSMVPYVRMQNVLTLANHKGMTEVAPLYKLADQEFRISETAKTFIKDGDKYGGFGETRVEWKEISNGQSKDFYKVVPDMLPTQVKQGLLDVERLSELKGEAEKEGGLVANPARNKEISEIEARLAKTPQEIKDFAERFSEMNKAVEYIGVRLGVSNKAWVDALNADPRWAQYMTRQSLTPGYASILKDRDPTAAKILSEKRKGYYAQNYIDPMLALSMKVEALGNAYAWNEISKVLVATEMAQGKLVAGKGGVETARRLEEVRDQIKNSIEFRSRIDYDGAISRVQSDNTTISGSFRKINDLLHLPEQISLRSIYESAQNPVIKNFVSDFEAGKVKFADGVKEAAGLSDSDASSVIRNTYSYQGVKTADAFATSTEKRISALQKAGVKGDNVFDWVWNETRAKENYPAAVAEMLPENSAKLFMDEFERFSDNYSLVVKADATPEEMYIVFGVASNPDIAISTRFRDALTEAFIKEKNGDIAGAKAIIEKYNGGWDFLTRRTSEMLLKKLGIPDGDVRYWVRTNRAEDGSMQLVKNVNDLPKTTRDFFKEEFEKSTGKKFDDIAKEGGADLRILAFLSEDKYDYDSLFSTTLSELFIREKSGQEKYIQRIKDHYYASDAKTQKEASATNIPDNVSEKDKASMRIPGYNAGVTPGGVPYRYTIENGQITSLEKITDVEGIADSISNLGGTYRITPDMVEKMGNEHAFALNRTILFYRDNMPNLPIVKTFKIADGDSDGTIGWCYKPRYDKDFKWKLENGKIVATGGCNVHVATNYYAAGKEDYILEVNRQEVAKRSAPKNAYPAEYTPIHEMGHMTMDALAILEANRKIESGEIDVETRLREKSPWESEGSILGEIVQKEVDRLFKEMAEAALQKLGFKFSEDTWREQANTISTYAGGKYIYKAETFSEAMADYAFNNVDAQKFSLAIVEEMKKLSERYAVAAEPGKVFEGNALKPLKGMFKDDNTYAFPENVKTDKQKAEWLDGWRKKNPYAKGKEALTEEGYRKANLWDTFFQKEIRALDPNSKSEMPSALVKKNGDFLEELSRTSAKRMVEEIKKASIEGFDQKLATMALSKNSKDIATAIDGFIIQRMNKAAEEIAAKMPGGLTDENLNKARITLWGEPDLVDSFTNMVSDLAPDLTVREVRENIATLFKQQAEGFASIEKLPIEVKELSAEERTLREKLLQENKYSIKKGKEADQALKDTYLGEATQVVHYRQGGEDVYVVVNDPVVANLLKRPNQYKETGVTVEAIAQMSNFLARTYRLGTTGINPIALIRNVLRDPVQAVITGGFNPLNMNLSPEAFYHSLRQFGLDDNVIKDVSQKIRVWAGSSGLTAEMRNMGVNGTAAFGYRNNVERISKKLNEKVLGSKVFEVGEAPLESWETMFRNQIGQQSFIKNYRKTGDVNKALSASLFDTSNATTNFSHSIGMFNRATATIPYLSSAINGTASFWRLFNMDPIGMTTRIVAGFMVPAMAITAWNLSDEERRKAYMNLPEWYRQSHIILLDMDNRVLACPIPEEIEQFFGTARKLIEFTQESSPYSLPQILMQGAFGFLPMDMDGFSGEDGSVDWGRGFAQLGSGILPQAFTTLYEFITEQDLYTGQDLSNYNGLNKAVYTLTNIFGTGFRQVINDIGMLCGASEKDLVGKSTANTLARDLFGLGFDEAKNQFMSLVGNPAQIDPQTGKETKATGLFAENEKLKKEIKTLDSQIAYSDESKKAELEELKTKKIQDFTDRVANLTNKYMQLYSITGGLEEWKKEKLVKLLTLSDAWTSADSDSYQAATTSEAYLNERALAQQRYLNAGLPGGPSLESLPKGSIDLQAAINRFYGAPKQATQDYKNAVESTGLKDIRNEFYDAINRIYDIAEVNNESPDYDMIEKIQARYLQAVDAVLVPIINQYGVGILNNNDFIDAVRRQVNGMIPSDDWKQSAKNAKRFLSTKEFPTATVDVKKWLKQRYSGSIRNRNIDSDPEVVEQLQSIKADIDAGRRGAAQGKIQSLRNGISRANYYISATDLQTLTKYADMVK